MSHVLDNCAPLQVVQQNFRHAPRGTSARYAHACQDGSPANYLGEVL